MKKTLVCMAVICAMMSAATASYAASYNTQENKVTSTAASDKKAVIIVKGAETTAPADEDIVYVNQADSTFGAKTEFLIKSSPTEGEYTVMYGGGTGGKTTETFYIGVGDLAGDTPMDFVGSSTFTGADGKTTYSMGYTATVNVADYKSVIIKKSDNTYMGCNIPTTLEGDGTVKIGIQINGAASDSEISGVWISKMAVNGTTASSADSQ